MSASFDAARRPRLGFLGLGWIGRARMESLLASGAAEAAVVADPAAAALDEARRLAPAARAAGSLDEILEQVESLGLDGLVIATPSALHAEQTVAALDVGLAVFCQKPLGRSAAEVEREIAAARAADRLLGVDLCYRETTAMRRIRELVNAGELGRVHAARLVFHNAYGPDKPWFRDPKLAGGGCLMDLGVHLVDLALWTLADFEPCAATARCLVHGRPLAHPDHEVEDYAVARIDGRGGEVVEIACSWNLHAGREAVIEASFWGSEGGAAMFNVGGSYYDFRAELHRGTATETLAEPPDAWGGRALVSWARRLAIEPGFDPAAEEYVRSAALVDALYERDDEELAVVEEPAPAEAVSA